MRVQVTIEGVPGVVARLDRFERGVEDLAAPLTEAGACLVTRMYERITGRPTSVYSASYLKFLLRAGDLDGKILGILTGALIGATAPGPASASGASLRAELEAGGEAALVGFLDPGQEEKAEHFNDWHERKFGEPAISVTAADERAVQDIFRDWMEGLANDNKRTGAFCP